MTCGGVGTVGTCTPAVSGTDVRNDCTADAATTCGNDGICDGAGACRKWAAGHQLRRGRLHRRDAAPDAHLQRQRTCAAGTPSSCGMYQCSATGAASCKTSCTTDTDCNNGFCSAGAASPTTASRP